MKHVVAIMALFWARVDCAGLPASSRDAVLLRKETNVGSGDAHYTDARKSSRRHTLWRRVMGDKKNFNDDPESLNEIRQTPKTGDPTVDGMIDAAKQKAADEASKKIQEKTKAMPQQPNITFPDLGIRSRHVDLTTYRNELGAGLLAFIIAQMIWGRLKRIACLRCIPFVACAAYALGGVGTTISAMGYDGVHTSVRQLKATEIADDLDYVVGQLAILNTVNGAALAICFAGAGCFRQLIFDYKTWRPGPKCILQIVLGPPGIAFTQFALWLTLAVQVSFSYLYLMMGVFLFMLDGLCEVGSKAIANVDQMISDFEGALSLDTGMDLMKTYDLDAYCKAIDSDPAMSALKVFGGYLLTIFSQAAMLTAIATVQAHIEEEIESDSDAEKEAAMQAGREEALTTAATGEEGAGVTEVATEGGAGATAAAAGEAAKQEGAAATEAAAGDAPKDEGAGATEATAAATDGK